MLQPWWNDKKHSAQETMGMSQEAILEKIEKSMWEWMHSSVSFNSNELSIIANLLKASVSRKTNWNTHIQPTPLENKNQELLQLTEAENLKAVLRGNWIIDKSDAWIQTILNRNLMWNNLQDKFLNNPNLLNRAKEVGFECREVDGNIWYNFSKLPTRQTPIAMLNKDYQMNNRNDIPNLGRQLWGRLPQDYDFIIEDPWFEKKLDSNKSELDAIISSLPGKNDNEKGVLFGDLFDMNWEYWSGTQSKRGGNPIITRVFGKSIFWKKIRRRNYIWSIISLSRKHWLIRFIRDDLK